MKASTKALLSGAALITATAGGGAFYASNYVIPEQIAASMNAAFSDAYGKGDLGSNITVKKTGEISVEPAGLFTYKVTMPGFDVKGDAEGTPVSGSIGKVDYNLTIENKVEALASAFNPDQEVAARLRATEPVKMAGHATISGGENVNINTVCNSLTHEVVLKNGKYSINTTGSDCSLDAASDESAADIRAGMSFTSNLSNLDNDYAGSSQISFSDFTVTAYEFYDKSKVAMKIVAGKIDVGVNYDGLSASARGKDPADFNISDLPDKLKFLIDVDNLSISGEGIPANQARLSFNGGVSVDGLKSDNATIRLDVGYDAQGLGDFALIPQSPEASSCTVKFGNVPAKQLGQSIEKNVKEVGNLGFAAPQIAADAVDQAGKGTGVTLDLDCSASSGARYSSDLEASHTIKGHAFPGSGKLELHGFKEAVKDLSAMVGPQIQLLAQQFTAMAKPAKDGDGLIWEYKLDDAGNLTVNDQPLGPVLAPR